MIIRPIVSQNARGYGIPVNSGIAPDGESIRQSFLEQSFGSGKQ
jgi:hypothetical protein